MTSISIFSKMARRLEQGILAAMNKYLVEQPQKGDIVVLYIAGHGSLRVNTKSNKQTFDLGGKPTPLDNTIVPADAYLGSGRYSGSGDGAHLQ